MKRARENKKTGRALFLIDYTFSFARAELGKFSIGVGEIIKCRFPLFISSLDIFFCGNVFGNVNWGARPGANIRFAHQRHGRANEIAGSHG